MLTLKRFFVVGALTIALVLGIAAYNVFKAPAASSGTLEAIPIAATAAPAAQAEPTAASATDTPAAQPEPTAAAAEQPAATAEASAQAGDTVTFQISQEESEARFLIDEVLNNAPKTVVGATSQVAGEIAIDPANPDLTRIGVIQISARDLTTDSEFRNRAIKNSILDTDQYELITFTPSEVIGLPDSASVGEGYTFQIVGDLTIRDVTQRVTFEVSANAASDQRLEGTATATINYADFGISIPQVPQVASVAEQVRLELEFVALAA